MPTITYTLERDPDASYEYNTEAEQHELEVTYRVHGPEPDVGIFEPQIEITSITENGHDEFGTLTAEETEDLLDYIADCCL